VSLDLGTLVAHVKLDDGQYQRSVTGAQAKIQQLKRDLASIGVTKARIDADSAGATAKIKALQGELKGLSKEIQLGVVTKDTSERIEAIKTELASLSDEKAKISIDSAAANAKIKAIRAELARVGGDDVTAKVHVKTDGVNFAFRGVNMLTTAIVALGPIAVPVLAAVAAGAGVLGSSLLTAGAAGGVFAAAVMGQVARMKTQQTQLKSLRTSLDSTRASQQQYKVALDATTKGTTAHKTALHAYQAAQDRTTAAEDRLTKAQQRFNRQFGPAATGLHHLTSAWGGFLSSTRKSTLGAMGSGLDLVAGILPRLVPLTNAAGNAVNNLLADLGGFADSKRFQGILDFFMKYGPSAITVFGHVAGNVILGVFGLFRAFAPYQASFLNGIEAMSRAFLHWSDGFGKSNGFHSFMAYAQQVLPEVADLFVSAATFVGRFVVALGPLAGIEFKGLLGLLHILNSLPTGVLTVLAVGITAVVLGLKAWEIGTKAVTVAQKIAAVSSKVMAAAQWALNAAMSANPIALVIIGIVALGVALVIAYKKSATFRGIVNGAFHAVGAAASWLWDQIKKLGGVADNVFHPVGAVGKWLWNNALQPTFRFIVSGIGTLMLTWGKMLRALSHVPGFGWAKGAADAMLNAGAKALGLAASIKKIPDSHTTRVTVNGVEYASAAVARLARQYNVLPRNIATQITTTHIEKMQRLTGHASGTPNFRGGLTRVGEHGPEYVSLPAGSRIWPTGQAQAAQRSAGLGAGGRMAPLAAGDLVIREYIDLERYERQQAFRERAATV